MRLPKVHGVIRRRLLVNFRADPALVAGLPPAPFRPKLHDGWAIVGICLIRLEEIRPKGFPRLTGLASENAAHRIAVVWDEAGTTHEGVYIPRRDTGSLVNQLAGGRLFPGEHQRAAFEVVDTPERVSLAMRSTDGAVHVRVVGRPAAALPPTSIFPSVEAASAFFEPGSVGFSATASGRRLDQVVLTTQGWTVAPLAIEHVESSWFADATRFPAGSISFDCALIMRNVDHEWHDGPSLDL
jgi:Uncharacterized conserved protein (COG2071)